MQIKIALCDDDINIQFAIEEFLQHILQEYHIDYEVECYDSGDQLCASYEKGMYDLLFLDIEYKGKNGVEVGKHIREWVGDELVQIAYISGNTGYAMELFEYRPINFLVKPISELEVRKVVDKFLRLRIRKWRLFPTRSVQTVIRYPCQIFYIFPAGEGRSPCMEEKKMQSFMVLWRTYIVR